MNVPSLHAFCFFPNILHLHILSLQPTDLHLVLGLLLLLHVLTETVEILGIINSKLCQQVPVRNCQNKLRRVWSLVPDQGGI